MMADGEQCVIISVILLVNNFSMSFSTTGHEASCNVILNQVGFTFVGGHNKSGEVAV